MMQKILVLLLVLLPSVYGQTGGLRTDKFILYTNDFKTNWWAAQSTCRRHHTDLVTIRDEEENLDFVSGYGWIGLHRQGSNLPWKWSRGDEIANFTLWESGELDSNDRCAYKYPRTQKWRGGSCDDIHSFMCSDEKLVLVKKKKTWEDALIHCRRMEPLDKNKKALAHKNHRFDLATLITQDDHDFAREKAQEATTDEVWTGLRYLAGEWMWVGGETVEYQDITSCPTEKLCGVLEKNGTRKHGRSDCEKKMNFLCYRKN
ncbi:secretory phospholipase A2 receptor-like [Trachinotus anak]|uniref:secretory phospholipase A2 receptor-like n=1 Tax=Trachinotus anak TaxID=443729 RepID=UPI0039F17D43